MTSAHHDRAVLAARGLAVGDALGAAASEHRTIRDPWVRGMLRTGAAELDAARVVRPVHPFVLSAIGQPTLAATDDAEGFVVAARVLTSTPHRSAGAMFDTWLTIVGGEDVWLGPAQRSAVLNAGLGLRPPATGVDNPAFYDDTALPGSLAAAIVASDGDEAVEIAGAYASMTHDGVGLHAARAFARITAECLAGTRFAAALDAARDELAADDWLAVGVSDARAIIADRSPFAALPALIARFAPRTYSHAGTVAETLPLAIAVVEATGGESSVALPLALSVARHHDSLPALVGALCGALGHSVGDAAELEEADVLHGVLVPGLAGARVRAEAAALAARR